MDAETRRASAAKIRLRRVLARKDNAASARVALTRRATLGLFFALNKKIMKKSLFGVLCLGGAFLTAPALAAPPTLPPGVLPGVVKNVQQNDVLFWYNLLPPNVFAAFGNVDRSQLLQSQGAIYDKDKGFIEVLMPGDPNTNDVEKLQVKLYRANAGLVVAVSQVVWNQPRVPAVLAFYGATGSGQLIDATQQVFPFDLQAADAPAPDAPAAGANPNDPNAQAPAAPVNAYLPRVGTTIVTGVAETKTKGDQYLWNGDVFVQGQARGNDRR